MRQANARRSVARRRVTALATTLLLAPTLFLACAQDPGAKKQAHYERGRAFEARGKLNEAIIEYRNALQVDGHLVPALRALAAAYRSKSWDEDAARELAKAARLEPASIPVQAELGRALLALEDWESCQGIGETIAGADPKHPYGPYLMGAAASGRGDSSTGLRLLAEALRLGPGVAEIQQAYGEALVRAERYGEAETAFRAVLAQNPKDADAMAGVAMALLKQHSVAAALEIANRARAQDPDNARVRLARSAVLSVQGKWAAAVEELESLPRQAWSPRFQLALAEVYLRNDRPEHALSVLDPLVKRFPTFVVARYLLAHAALAANRPDKALAEFQEVLRAAPTNLNARFSLGVAYIQAGQLVEALDILTALRPVMERQPIYHLQRALALAGLARWDDAIAAAEAARRLDPNRAEPYETLGRIYLARKDPARAQDMYARAIELKPDLTSARLALGTLLDFTRQPEAALQQYEAAAATDPRSQPAVVAKVTALVRAKRGDEALAFLDARIKSQGEAAPLLTLRGHVYLAKGQAGKAEAEYRRAIKADDAYAPARFALARRALGAGNEEQAIVHLHGVIAGMPGHAAAGSALAGLYARQARYDQAIQVLEPVAAANPRLPELRLQLAELYLQKGRFDDALRAVEPLVSKESALVPARLIAGLAHLGKSEPGAAIEELEHAVHANPKLAATHYYLARAFVARGEVEAAKRSYARALELEPGMPQVRIELAALSGQAQDPKLLTDHVAELRQILDKRPGDLTTRYALARAYLAKGQPRDAERELTRILDTAPGYAPANMALALIRFGERRNEEAVDHLRAVVRTSPSDLQAHLLLARYFDRSGIPAMAIEHYEAAVRVAPTRTDVRLRLAMLYAQTGRQEDALGRAREAVDALPRDAEARYVLGEVHLRRGEPADAADAFTTAVRLDPKHAGAQLGLGIAAEQRGEVTRALDAYARARLLAPEDARGYNNSAWLLASQGKNLDEALGLARRANELVARDKELATWVPAMMDTLGFVHFRRGELAQAEPLLRDAATRAPSVGTFHYHLALTYEGMGRRDDARVSALRATRLDQKLAADADVQGLLKRVGG
jgi:tetratricopeptide (TPR) repeat protein